MSRLSFSSGNHSYWLRDPLTGKKQRITSVSSLLNQQAKPALVKWAAREAANYAADNWDALTLMPVSERLAAIGAAPEQRRNTAAASGTAIHHWAELLLAGQPVDIPAEHVDTVRGLADWWERSGWTVVRSEARVWSEEDDFGGVAYAGTADLIAVDKWGQLVLADIKTGGVWPEAALQITGYALADNIVTLDDLDEAMARPQRLCVLHVRADGTTLHELEPDQATAAAERFQVLRALKGAPLPTLTQKEQA